MSKSIDIDKAGECLRNILDNNRCGVCDKLGSIYWRCEYGHVACNDCSAKEEGCFTCFATFSSPVTCNPWVADKLQTDKTKNALNLLHTFQDTFNVDIYKRQRISNQLKAEKELFPDCIQAPVKYSNKKKSLTSSIYNKENSQQSYYPGEKISPLPTSKMEKSKFVQQWLNSNPEKSSLRRPFANINVSNQMLLGAPVTDMKKQASYKSNKIKNNNTHKTKTCIKLTKNKKTYNSRHLKNPSLEKFFRTPTKEVTKKETMKPCNLNWLQQGSKGLINNKQDDSGIVIDDDVTPTEVIDKDEFALRAVHEAEKNEYSDYTSMYEKEDIAQHITKGHKDLKVPYKKKSLLYVSCPNCNTDAQNRDFIQGKNTNNISITIEYDSFDETNVNKQSISVQTEISDINDSSISTNNFAIDDNAKFEQLEAHENNQLDKKVKIGSQDLFMDDMDICNSSKPSYISGKIDQESPEMVSLQKGKDLVIDESDTDAEPEYLQIAAEVHWECEPQDYDILTEIDLNEMQNRKRRAKRGVTPGSTDSSEKENFDPNRIKRSKYTRKDKKKSYKS